MHANSKKQYVTVIVGCPTREEFVDIWLINDGSDTYIANSKLLTTIENLLHDYVLITVTY